MVQKIGDIKKWEIMRDPIYNYIEYNEELEKEIIDTVFMQRLRRVHQLHSSYFVYPGADHSRFQHSIGTMHLAGDFAKSLLSPYEGELEKDFLVEVVRLAALLHDVGHGPYSHAFDDAIIAPSRALKKRGIESHESITYNIVAKSKIGDTLDDWGIKEEVKALLAPKLEPGLKPYIKALRSVIKEGLYPADILDFLQRDAYFTGTKEYGYIDAYRLIKTSFIDGTDIVLAERAMDAFKSYLYSRFKMFETVYFHRTCRAIDQMLREMLEEVNDILSLTDRVAACSDGDFRGFVELNDYTVPHMILEHEKASKKAKQIVNLLLERKIPWKMIGERPFPFPARISHAINKYFDPEKLRRDIISNLKTKFEREFGKNGKTIPIFVDHTHLKSLPDNPYEEKGEIKVLTESKIESKLIMDIMEEFPMFKRKVRVYTSEKCKTPKVCEIAEKILDKVLSPLKAGITA